MRTITIVYQRCAYLHTWLKPMISAKKEFKKLGYKIEFQSIFDYFPFDYFPILRKYQKMQENKSIKMAMHRKHDIVMMAFHHSTSDLCQLPKEKRAEILRKIKASCNMLIWLDTADSTGTCMFDVMPYVDLYFKKQLLKKREDYCRDVYGARTFCEFYNDLLHIEDETITKRKYEPTQKQYLSKLRIAWNVGIGDLYARGWRHLLPFVARPKFTSPQAERHLDIQYRGSGYSPIAGYPRTESQKLLLEMQGEVKMSDISKRIPKSEFIKEGQDARSILSPFGWGEICGRDFEAFVYGACMIKQDMSHCETYPDAYQPYVTYVPLKWDFSDFKDKVLKARSDEYLEIAKKAQDFYKFYFTKAGRMDFAKHIVNEIEKK